MNRRAVITMLGGAAAWPLAARAQGKLPVIGFLSSGTLPPHLLAAFRQGLNELGYAEGHNVAFEFSPARGEYERFRPLAENLARRQVAVIVAPGGTVAALAAKETTSAIPIVFYTSGDPVSHRLVTSLNRPGGNLTGIGFLSIALGAKRLELLKELEPNIAEIAMLINPGNLDAEFESHNVQEAARLLGCQTIVVKAANEDELHGAFAAVVRRAAKALLVGADAFFSNRREQIVTLARHYSIPTIFDRREFVDAGGLMSYGHHRADAYHQLGIYTGRILKGEKPADLPVVQPTKFELVINLKTARALGLEIPSTLLARADEVIE